MRFIIARQNCPRVEAILNTETSPSMTSVQGQAFFVISFVRRAFEEKVLHQTIYSGRNLCLSIQRYQQQSVFRLSAMTNHNLSAKSAPSGNDFFPFLYSSQTIGTGSFLCCQSSAYSCCIAWLSLWQPTESLRYCYAGEQGRMPHSLDRS